MDEGSIYRLQRHEECEGTWSRVHQYNHRRSMEDCTAGKRNELSTDAVIETAQSVTAPFLPLQRHTSARAHRFVTLRVCAVKRRTPHFGRQKRSLSHRNSIAEIALYLGNPLPTPFAKFRVFLLGGTYGFLGRSSSKESSSSAPKLARVVPPCIGVGSC